MLLKEGDKIRAVGFPLLAGLNDGKVWKVEKVLGKLYKFVRGGKIVCFEILEVDSWLQLKGLNTFEIVNKT